MRIPVTGGAGFIGSNFVRYLPAEDPEAKVVNLDLLTRAGSLSNLRELPHDDRYTFVRGDIADAGLLARLLGEREIDTVIHFAAESHVGKTSTAAARIGRIARIQ